MCDTTLSVTGKPGNMLFKSPVVVEVNCEAEGEPGQDGHAAQKDEGFIFAEVLSHRIHKWFFVVTFQ